MKNLKSFCFVSLSAIVISNPVYASDIEHLDKGQSAPFEGMLFTIDKAKDVRAKLLERDTYEQLNKSLENSNNSLNNILKIKDEQINIVTERNNDLSSSLQSAQSMSTLEKLGWFVLGVGAAIFTFHVVRQTTQ